MKDRDRVVTVVQQLMQKPDPLATFHLVHQLQSMRGVRWSDLLELLGSGDFSAEHAGIWISVEFKRRSGRALKFDIDARDWEAHLLGQGFHLSDEVEPLES